MISILYSHHVYQAAWEWECKVEGVPSTTVVSTVTISAATEVDPMAAVIYKVILIQHSFKVLEAGVKAKLDQMGQGKGSDKMEESTEPFGASITYCRYYSVFKSSGSLLD
jgi:hypothetical protein